MRNRVREEDFFSKTPPARIIGAETEYTTDNHTLYGYASTAKSLFGMRRQFFPNGARMYPDMGNVEYGSAEGLGPLDAAAADHAGISILNDIYQETLSQVEGLKDTRSAARIPKFFPLRRAGGYSGMEDTNGHVSNGYATMGYHENLLTAFSLEGETYTAFLNFMGSFLATRHVWYGAGMVLHDGTLELSQKLFDAEFKSLMSIRREHDRLGRLSKASVVETRSGDAHMLPYATYMGFAATSLALRLFEQGIINPSNIDDWALANIELTTAELSTMSQDDYDQEVTLKNGAQMSVISYQLKLAELAHGLAQEITLPDDEVRAAQEWLKIMHSIEASGFDDPYLLGRVEHITKHALIQHIANRKKRTLDEMERVAIDLSFTKVDQRLAKRALELFGDDEVRAQSEAIYDQARNYTTTAPPTRARLRGKLIKTHGRNIDYVEWHRVTVNRRRIRLNDPYATNRQTVSFRSGQ